MGDNKEERKKMKKTRYVALVLLSSLLTLVGCSRREILDDYPVTGIDIRLDWEGVTGRLPEGVRVIFYPKDAQGRKIDTYLPAKGGEMKVPPGHYLAVIYNYDTEVVQVKGEDNFLLRNETPYHPHHDLRFHLRSIFTCCQSTVLKKYMR